jgi:hypothetical protein
LINGKSDFRRQACLHLYADSLDAAAMPGAINEAMQLPLQYRNGALAVLIARWAELDPAAAAKYANLLPKSASPGMLRRTAMTAWAEKDFAGALAWAQGLEKGDSKNESLTVLAGALAKRDPAAALQLIKDNFPPREAGNVYENVFATWSESDFAGALSAAQDITDLQLRSRALRATLNKRADTDPRAVLEYVRASKTSDFRSSVGRYAINRWLERDLTGARDYVMSLPAGETRDVQIREVAQEIGRRDPQEAIAWLDRLPEAERAGAVESIFGVLAGRDPNAAIDAARSLPEGRLQDSAISLVAQGLIETDLDRARDLLNELPEGSIRENSLNQIANRWARIDPKAAIDWYCANVPEGRRGAMGQMMSEWSRADPEGALKWAAALPEGGSKGEILAQVFAQVGRDDPASAARQIEKLTAESLRTAVPNFVSQWSNREPESAATWANTLRDEQAKAAAFAAVASQWGGRDPVAVARWIDKLPAGAARDAAVSSFSNTASKTDPEGAVAWALTIQSPDKQRGTLRDVYARWLRRDPAVAGAWVQTAATLPVEFRTELQAMAQPKATNK